VSEPLADGGSLDDPDTVSRLDSQGLLGRIEGLPEQCETAWAEACAVTLPAELADVESVVVLGMGGSAIAGDLLRSLATSEGRKPVTVVRSYDLPAFVTPGSLVIACSHSGNTEETLSAFQAALDRGLRAVVIVTGGRLLDVARERGIPALVYAFEGEPRSALGHQLMRLIAVGERAGVFGPQGPAVGEAVSNMATLRVRIGMSSRVEANRAKQLATRLHRRIPIVIGAGPLAEAAHRWKTQVNENANSWAIWEELPELDHNAVVGFGLPEEALAQLHAVFLSHSALHPRVLRRIDATMDELDRAGVSHERLDVSGESALAQILASIYEGDLVSYYLALLYGVEPGPVAPIDRLKARLADGE
jgi:glucose/mannose-6-phosphate isomerase